MKLRGRPKAAFRASNRVTVNLTDDDFARIKERAGGMSVAAYLRSAGLGEAETISPTDRYEPVSPKTRKAKSVSTETQTPARSGEHPAFCLCKVCAKR